MTSSPATGPPDSNVQRVNITNRSATLPQLLMTNSRLDSSPDAGSLEGREILFTHPHATIVKFTIAAPKVSVKADSPNRPSSSAGALPWRTPTETTMHIGQIEIFRRRDTVVYLQFRSISRPIFPRTQCWCVDGISKFVMRILPDTYYRIELPANNEDDTKQVEEFKAALAKVAWFERSACPFSRLDSTDLPEMPDVVRRSGRRDSSRAKRWRLERGLSWRPEDDMFGEIGDTSSAGGSQFDSDDSFDSQQSTSDDEHRPISESLGKLTKETRDVADTSPLGLKPVRGLRSFTAPIVSGRTASEERRIQTGIDVDEAVMAIEHAEREASARAAASAQTARSMKYRTFQTIPVDMPPSPPGSSAGLESTDVIAKSPATYKGEIQDSENLAFIAPQLSAEPTASPDQAPRPGSPRLIDNSLTTESTDLTEFLTAEERKSEVDLRMLPSEVGPKSTLISIDSIVAAESTVPTDSSALHHSASLMENGMSEEPEVPTKFDVSTEPEKYVNINPGIDPNSSMPPAVSIKSTVTPELGPLVEIHKACENRLYEEPVTSPEATTPRATIVATESSVSPDQLPVDAPDDTKDSLSQISPQDVEVKREPHEAEPRRDPPVLSTRVVGTTNSNEACRQLSTLNLIVGASGESKTGDSTTAATAADSSATEEDPYAAIKARILARRSIGSTTTFHSGQSKIVSSSPTRDGVARRPIQNQQDQEPYAIELFKKTFSTLLGPPSYIATVGLKIATRLATVAFGVDGVLHVATPASSSREVPGNFGLDGFNSDYEEDSSEEDDFGVPLRNPVRMA